MQQDFDHTRPLIWPHVDRRGTAMSDPGGGGGPSPYVAQAVFEQSTMPAYKAELAAFEARLESARQLVDRIAYSGKVPCNVTGATPGDYIVATAAADGSIVGVSVTEPDFAQYRKAVGRVNRLMPDGRCEVAVIVH